MPSPKENEVSTNYVIAMCSFYFIFLFIIANIFANQSDRNYFNKSQIGYVNLLTVIFFLFTIGLAGYFFKEKSKTNPLVVVFVCAALLGLLVFAYTLFHYVRISDIALSYFQYFISFLTILIFIVFLTILSLFWYEYLLHKYQGTPTEFVIRFLFFFPCLLRDFLQYLSKDLKNTPYLAFVLVLVEILLILMYVYIPRAIKNTSFKDFVLVRDKPFFLRNEYYLNTEITTFREKVADNVFPISFIFPKPAVIPSNIYSYSMWILIKETNDNVRGINETTDGAIFSYGDSTKQEYRPRIAYHAHDTTDKDKQDPFTDKIRIEVTKTYSYDLNLAKQKWYNIIVTYWDNRVEIHLNGKLAISISGKDAGLKDTKISNKYNVFLGEPFQKGRFPPDIIICNVHLYNTPLHDIDIASVYNIGVNSLIYPGSYV